MIKKCLYCGKYFVVDRRVGARQKACYRDACKKARKKEAQAKWFKKNPDYFKGDYWRIKEWRHKKRQTTSSLKMEQDMIQDKIPLAKPLLEIILLIPEDKSGVIQDEIRLKRVGGYTFMACG